MGATAPRARRQQQVFARARRLLVSALVTGVSSLVGVQAGLGATAAGPLWPSGATPTAGPRAGQTVGLVPLDNTTREDAGARLAAAGSGTANFVAEGASFGSPGGSVSLVGYRATSSRRYALPVAASPWSREPSPTGQALNAVSCVPGKAPTGVGTGYCYAVGNDGTVLFSSDGGLTWSREVSPVKVDLLGVTCLPLALARVPLWCWAVGGKGTILFTKNGLPWATVPVSPATGQPFSAVACQANGQRCWAVGTAVAAELEAAVGSGWRLVTIPGPAGSECGPGGPSNACLRGVAVGNTDERFAVGGGGNIYEQLDERGPGWSDTVSIGAGYFTSVACGPASADGRSHCIAVGTDGSLAASRIEVTFDSGASWVPATSPANGTLPPLRAVSVLAGSPAGGLAWAVGDRGTIIRSSDGGRTWAREAAPTTAGLLGLSCPGLAGPRVVCVAVGAAGTILVRRTLPASGGPARPYLYLDQGGVVDQLFSWPHFPRQLVVQDVTRIVGLRWTSTTPSEAQARGTFEQSGCSVTCAAGPWSSWPVELTASQPKTCTVQVMHGEGPTGHPVTERVLVYSSVLQAFTGGAARRPPSVLFSC